MFDMSKLRGKIVEKFKNLKDFADAVHRSRAFVSDVLNGKRYLKQTDIDSWAQALDIPAIEIPAYFFSCNVHET